MCRTLPRRRKSIWMDGTMEFALLALPAFILVFIFCYIPMGGAIIAFKDYKYDTGILGSAWVGFKNFEFFFQSNDAWRITRNTLGMNALFIVVGTIFDVGFALMLYEIKQKWRIKTYQTIMLFPHFISWVIVGYMVYAFLNPSIGFVNVTLQKLGIEPISWYSEPKYWPAILTFAYIWKHVGMNLIIYYAALMGIDQQQFEAARIDGASRIKQIWYISIPSIRSTIIILTILAIGKIFRADFGMFYQLTRDVGQLYPTTDVIDTYIYRSLLSLGDIGMSSAVGLFQSFVGFILIITTNTIVKKIEEESALF